VVQRLSRWLTTAKNANGEHAAKNNHGSWFLRANHPDRRYCGRDDLAKELCEEDKMRIASQFKPDGSQPEEIRRVDGLGYSQFNLEAQFQVAHLATPLGCDLWNYTDPNGASSAAASSISGLTTRTRKPGRQAKRQIGSRVSRSAADSSQSRLAGLRCRRK